MSEITVSGATQKLMVAWVGQDFRTAIKMANSGAVEEAKYYAGKAQGGLDALMALEIIPVRAYHDIGPVMRAAIAGAIDRAVRA